MKVTKAYKNGLTFEFVGEKFTDLFEQIAACDEVFGDNATTCRAKMNGKVYESNNVVFRVRQDSEENKYYELLCLENDVAEGKLKWFKKRLGVNKKGNTNLFPKRQVPEGEIPGFDGWSKYVKDNDNDGDKETSTTSKSKGKKSDDGDSTVPF